MEPNSDDTARRENADAGGSAPEAPRVLTPAAERALAEAQARRRAAQEASAATAADGREPAREVGGRAGPDPVRYGDWEKGGIASDF